MSAPIIEFWGEDHRRAFRRGVVSARHGLADEANRAALFSDAALAALIDAHPPHLIDVLTMGETFEDRASQRAGATGGLSGAQLIEAVRTGRIWINLKRAMNEHRAYRAVLTDMFHALARLNPGFAPGGVTGGILISSPNAFAFYHADTTETALWHVRGDKRLYVYPPRAPYLSETAYESVVLDGAGEVLPYEPAWDADAVTVEMSPGALVSWAHGSPHRIVNGPNLNVTVTTDFLTWEGRARRDAFFVNAVARRYFGAKPSYVAPQGVRAATAMLQAAALKRLARAKQPRVRRFDHFEVDLKAPRCVRPYERPQPRMA